MSCETKMNDQTFENDRRWRVALARYFKGPLMEKVLADGTPEQVAANLQLGGTGEYPEGRLDGDDEGGLRAALTVECGKLVLRFGKNLSWIAMTPDEAEIFGNILIDRARKAREKGDD